MFRLVTGKPDIASCQRKLEGAMRGYFHSRLKRNIGYPSDTLYDAIVLSDGRYWYHTRDLRDEGAPRRLNWFGLFNEHGNLQITVELNVPFEGRNDQIAGFFFRETRSKQYFLGHSGRVGGGTPGVGKIGFLSWTDKQLIDIEDDEGQIREGILVTALGQSGTGASITSYIASIAAYKAAVRAGETSKPEFQLKQHHYKAYYEEARGRRKGTRRADIDYITRHGDIVSAIHKWRLNQPNPRLAKPVKDILIDFGMAVGNNLIEVYEAKSAADRSSIYKAIGQVFVHGPQRNCVRTVVLPDSEILSEELFAALERLGVKVLRFRFNANGASIVE
jgi:hypothetical protein